MFSKTSITVCLLMHDALPSYRHGVPPLNRVLTMLDRADTPDIETHLKSFSGTFALTYLRRESSFILTSEILSFAWPKTHREQTIQSKYLSFMENVRRNNV